MKVFVGASALLLAAAVGSSGLAAPEGAVQIPAAAPLEAYGRLPTLEYMRLSPDGTKIAFVKTFKEGRMLVIIARDHPAVVLRGMKVDRDKLRDVEWIDDDHVMVVASTAGYAAGVISEKQEWVQAFSFEISTGRQHLLLADVDDQSIQAMNVLRGSPMVRRVDGKTVVFLPGLSFVDHKGTSTLFRTDPNGRFVRVIAVGEDGTRGWMVSADGEILARVDYAEQGRKWVLKIKTPTHGWRERLSLKTQIDAPSVLGFDGTGKSLVLRWLSDEDRANGFDGPAVYTLPIEGDVAPQKWRDIDFEGAIHDPSTHALIGGAPTGMQMGEVFFDPHDQAQWDVIAKAFPGEGVSLHAWSQDRKVMIVHVEGKRDGSSYSLVDLHTGHADFQGDRYSGIGPEQMGEQRLISYRASDGLEIPALLTLPSTLKAGADARNLPLVVLPHGGPEGVDRIGFNWWVQAMASQGWAVLQPEFRGSSGFGLAHLRAGYGQMGRKMQLDLSDGVRYLAGQGEIDPRRVAIVGESYGGYAALAGAAFDRKQYRCAVSVAGISDPRRHLQWAAQREETNKSRFQRYWDRLADAKGMNDPALDEISPLKHVDAIDIPVLLIHGKDDTVVDYGQSVAMHEALKAAGKPVEMVTLKNEDHWLSRSETRTQMLTESIRFLKACNPPT